MTAINPQVMQHIADLGTKALYSKAGQEALFSEEGISSAKSIAYGVSLSSVAKGKSDKIRTNIAYMASQALNSFDTIRALEASEEECVICSMIFQRISECNISAMPENLDEYHQMVGALQNDNFNDPSYVKLKG